jgi:polyisoprenoid-binding protein YceI
MALRGARLWAWGALLTLSACSKPDPPARRTEPWLATPSASGAFNVGAPRLYRFTSDSSISFSVSGHKEKLNGHLPLASGELHIDPRDLQQTQANLTVDLTKLSIDTPPPSGLELGASSPDALALQWLELGPQVPAERRAQFTPARFELHALENLSSTILLGGGKSGAVRAAAIGTLLIHGFRAPVRVEVSLRKLPASSDPERVSIRSVGALVVSLVPHDITARDAAGVVDALGAARAADWVGKTAHVQFELVAQATGN